MANKLIITMLILLLAVSGGLGYYSYTLNQQVDLLNGQMITLQQEQIARFNSVSNELTTFRGESNTRFDTLTGEIGKADTRIEGLQSEIDTETDSLREEIAGTQTEIERLGKELEEGVSGLSRMTMDANKVYEKVSEATVRISNGEGTAGSGFLFDTAGHVATAYHVIENLDRIYVIFPDGRVSSVTNRASSPDSDVAILTITDKPDITPPPLADSSKLKIGEPVVAIGSPFDLEDTLTAGVVSQTNRYVEITSDSQTRWIPNLIQFDAPANPGNSGCALFNSQGEVVGVVIARVNPEEGDGIYYAVSANKLERVAAALIAQGSFDYPWLGVNITDLTPRTVQDMGLETANGALVVGVTAGGPAQTAGIRVDDIIINLDDFPIRNTADLTSYLGEYKSPDDETTIGIIRDSDHLEISLKIGRKP
ncbi:trypsin-like peptidase domain-containing protein [Chloroflexota bacterium]